MSRTEARIKCSIWDDPDYLALSLPSKLAYQFLLQQSDINLLGVVPYRPVRWERRLGMTIKGLEAALAELASARFILLDVLEGELAVRTFMRHDHVLGSPLVEKGARSRLQEVNSPSIRAFIACQLSDEVRTEWGLDTPSEGGCDRVSDTGLEVGGRRKEVRGKGLEADVTTSRAKTSDPIADLFAVYQERHPKAVLTSDRRRRLAPYLKSHGEHMCEAAIRGIVYSPFHMGDNDQGKSYDDWEVIFKNAKNLEAFAGYWTDPSTRPKGKMSASEEWGERVSRQFEEAREALARERGELGAEG